MIRHLRKQRDTLRISGLGVIAFGLWSVVRSIVYAILGTGEIRRVISEAQVRSYALSVVYAVVMLVLLADLGLRMFVGMKARQEASGKDAGLLFLIVTGLLSVSHLISIPMDILFFARGEDPLIEMIATVFIEATSLVTLGTVMWTTVSSRRLARQIPEGEEAGV